MVMTPIQIGFSVSTHCPEGIWMWEAAIDWFFVCDLILNFFTAILMQVLLSLPVSSVAFAAAAEFAPFTLCRRSVGCS